MTPQLAFRIERYVAACPEAVSGSGGHSTTFRVAIVLVRGFALSPAEAMPFMQRYNQRCQPPWTERELRHKLYSALLLSSKPGRILKARGYLL
jgi:hypothetical protein